jgi:gamma-glutamyltranspeptidase/glutathione hydrolase
MRSHATTSGHRVGSARFLGIVVIVVALAGLPTTPVGAAAPICKAGIDPGCLPTPQECATGSFNGNWDGGFPGRFAECLGGGGHIVHYEGGYSGADGVHPPCGVIIKDDQIVVGGWADPNMCPPASAPPGQGVPGRAFVPAGTSERGVVASVSPLASQAGIEVLNGGGNAMDAAVATAFAVGVTRPDMCGIGGQGALVYRSAEGEVATLDFLASAPAAFGPETFDDPGLHDAGAGHLVIGVPGTVAGLSAALGRFGTIDLARAIEPAWQLAEEGFPVSTGLATMYGQVDTDHLRLFPESARVYLRNGAREYPPDNELADSTLVLADYARSLALVATFGPQAFYQDREFPGFTYRGTSYPAGRSIGRLILEEMNRVHSAPGDRAVEWTAEDLSAYRAIWRTPLVGTYRGSEITTLGPAAGGGVIMLETLNISEGFPFASPGWEASSANRIHIMAEAHKLARADSTYVSDPDFEAVPTQTLTSKKWAAERGAEIDMHRAKDYEPGDIDGGDASAGEASSHAVEGSHGAHTTHLSVIDGEGNAASVTCTVSGIFGSAVVAPGTGFVLNDSMTNWLCCPPDEPQGGKRPWSSLAPAIVVRDGVPILVVGGAGGISIPMGVALAISNVVDFEMDVALALDAARFFATDDYENDSCCALTLQDGRILQEVQEELEARGHTLTRTGEYGGAAVSAAIVQAVGTDPATGLHVGSSDPQDDLGTLAQAERGLTGGGAILGTGLSKGAFTVDVSESLEGKIGYRDLGAAIDFRSSAISSVVFDELTPAVTIRGAGLNNGAPVTFTVVATDNGEPGTADEFRITLSSGYARSGKLIQGNLQIH